MLIVLILIAIHHTGIIRDPVRHTVCRISLVTLITIVIVTAAPGQLLQRPQMGPSTQPEPPLTQEGKGVIVPDNDFRHSTPQSQFPTFPY